MKTMITCGMCGRFKRGRGRGLCGGCYSAARRAGTLPPLVRPSFEQRLAEARQGRTDDECWPWPGNISVYGYGRIGQKLAHREVYEREVSPIPVAEELDHLCHTLDASCPGGSTCPHRRCVNYVRHLEPVTSLENWMRGRSTSATNLRKTHCDHDHLLAGDNLIVRVYNGRQVRFCRACIQARSLARAVA